MKISNIENMQELLDFIEVDRSNQRGRGRASSVVVSAKLWDGRKIQAAHYKGPEFLHLNVGMYRDTLSDDGVAQLHLLVRCLLDKNESFVTITHTDGYRFCLEWSLVTK